MALADRETVRRMTDDEFRGYLDELRKDYLAHRERSRLLRERSIAAEQRWRAARAEFRARFGY